MPFLQNGGIIRDRNYRLQKRFANEQAICYENMEFAEGKSYMLLGASGCGKSTLLNMIAGILSPETGQIFINGLDMTAKSQKEKDEFRIEKSDIFSGILS